MHTGGESPSVEQRVALYSLLDQALPEVYDYLFYRCRQRQLAEDLTSETFLAAIAAAGPGPVELTVAWLIGIARHKLADHWRRQAREERHLAMAAGTIDAAVVDEPLDTSNATEVLSRLNPMQRAALTLRYVDGLSVPEVAGVLGRSVHATETLLVRAKAAFRRIHAELAGGDHG